MFNLALALKGHPVQMKKGTPITNLRDTIEGIYPLHGELPDGDLVSFTRRGTFLEVGNSPYDLEMTNV